MLEFPLFLLEATSLVHFGPHREDYVTAWGCDTGEIVK